MADSRFHLKVEFEIYGKRFKWEPSLNWAAGESGIDDRIRDWFLSCHDKAYGEFQEALYEQQQAAREAEIEAKERSELKRLQDKYGKT